MKIEPAAFQPERTIGKSTRAVIVKLITLELFDANKLS